MSKDIDETLKDAEKAVSALEEMANQKMDDAEQKIKKGIVQTVIWVLVTIAIYFMWGTTWFFWLSLVFNVMLIAGIVFAKVMMAKAYKKIAEMDNDDTSLNMFYGFGKDIDDYDDDDEEIEYDEKQQKLETLLNTLEEIGEEHGEIYDTECREQMSEAIFSAFIFEKENYVIPDSFGLHKEEGNKAVKEALTVYIEAMLPLAKEFSAEERLEMFQDDDVVSEEGQEPDEFFGWIDSDDLESMR